MKSKFLGIVLFLGFSVVGCAKSTATATATTGGSCDYGQAAGLCIDISDANVTSSDLMALVCTGLDAQLTQAFGSPITSTASFGTLCSTTNVANTCTIAGNPNRIYTGGLAASLLTQSTCTAYQGTWE